MPIELSKLRTISLIKQDDGNWQFLCVHDADGVVLQGKDLPDAEACMETIIAQALGSPGQLSTVTLDRPKKPAHKKSDYAKKLRRKPK